MALNNLAEAVILQALEDMWTERYFEDSIDFFASDRFPAWSLIAGLDAFDQYKVLLIASKRLNAIRD